MKSALGGKKIFAGISVLALLAVAFPLSAADNATVTSTVTPELIAISVVDGSVAYGVLPLNTVEDTTSATGVDETQTISNDGNVDVDLTVKSGDATSTGTPWNLAAAKGGDEFTHEFSDDSGSSWTAFNADNITYTAMTTNVSATQDMDLRIGTPTSSTDTLEYSIAVTVLATAS